MFEGHVSQQVTLMFGLVRTKLAQELFICVTLVALVSVETAFVLVVPPAPAASVRVAVSGPCLGTKSEVSHDNKVQIYLVPQLFCLIWKSNG